MKHDEATLFFDVLGDGVSASRPPMPDLIAAGRAAERRRTRKTLALVAASVALVLGGGAVAQRVVAEADDRESEIDPATVQALRNYDPQAMPRLMDERARAVFSRSIQGLPVSEFRADDESFQALPSHAYGEAQSMEVLYRLPDQHELWFYIGHGRSYAEGDARSICASGLDAGLYLTCEVRRVGDDVAMVTVNASADGWMGRELGLRPSKGDDPDDRQVVTRDDLDAIDPTLLMFERTVKVVHSETFVSVVRETVNAPTVETATEAFEVPVADLVDLATDPTMVIPEPSEASTPPEPQAPEGMRLVGMDRVAVAVPESWGDAHACEGDLIAPPGACREGEDATPSLSFFERDSQVGRNLEIDNAREVTYNGVAVSEGELRCPPTASCVAPMPYVVVVPDRNVVLMLGGPAVEGDLRQAILDSLQVLPEGYTTVPYIAPGTPNGPAGNALIGAGLVHAMDVEPPVPTGRQPIAGTSPSAHSVVRIGSTVTMLTPVSSGYAPNMSMTVSPATPAPGEIVSLGFPQEQGRGVGFTLTTLQGESTYYLTSDGGRSDVEPSWSATNTGWRDLGVGGPGPDRVLIPEVAEPGDYSLCTANAQRQSCATLTVE